MNTLLITIDSFRRDHLGFHGYNRNTTPFLDSIAEENTVFENAFASSTHTREAIPPILTGKKPENCIKKSITGPKLDAETISDILPNDVKSFGVTSGVYLTPVENQNQGFDKFNTDYKIDNNFFPRQAEYIIREVLNRQFRPAEAINRKIVNTLDTEKNCFVWSHYMDLHQPYNKFDEYNWGDEVSKRKLQYLFRKAKYFPSSIDSEEKEILENCYDNCIRHLDDKLRQLFQEIPDHTTVFIVGDHGESFGENGRYEHPRELKPELLKVPLIVKNGKDRRVERTVSTKDIAPTIAEMYDQDMDGEGQCLHEERCGKVTASCLKDGKRIKRSNLG